MRIIPILFSADMVRALLEERTSVTRRLVKPQPPIDFRYPQADYSDSCWWWTDKDGDDDMMRWWPSYENGLISPYQPGDILYVRETWAYSQDAGPTRIIYKADEQNGPVERWLPSIHMEKRDARIFLRVTDVQVDRLQDITEEQARAEGVGDPYDYQPPEWYEAHKELAHSAEIAAYAGLWDRLYAKPMPVKENGKVVRYESYPWENIKETRTYRGKPWLVIGNPWVWVIEFGRTGKPAGWPGEAGK